MKLNKAILTLAAGCAVVSTVHADQIIYISGSTAYRKATYPAFQALFGAGLLPNYPIGDTSSTATGSGAANVVNGVGAGSANLVWKGTIGTIPALGTVTIVCNWSGSISGQKADAESALWPTFLDPATVAGTENFIPAVPTMNVSDNYQKTTTYTAALDPAAVNLTRIPVAVIEFLIAKDPSGPADLINVSSENLRALYSKGFMNMAQLTGNAAENTLYVLPTGRDDDSGTRTIFEADNGIAFTSTLLQWGIHSPAKDSVPDSVYQFPLGSINAADGNGYASGGTLAGEISQPGGPAVIVDPSGNTANNVNCTVIGYCGVNDAVGTILPANFLNYNGVAYTDAAIKEGQYTYWGYENLDYRTAVFTGGVKTFIQQLSAAMIAQAGTLVGTLPISGMNCLRTADGGAISHN